MCVGKRRITVKKKAKQREQLEEKECVSHCVQKSQSSFQKRKETLLGEFTYCLNSQLDT